LSKKTKVVDCEPSRFFCVVCGEEGIPLIRKPGAQREPGHLKKLFCLRCKCETNHAEIRPFGAYRYENFKEEFDLGRFTKDGEKIPIADLMDCSKIKCKYNKDGKCWNSNYDYDCPHRPKKENK